MTICGTTEYMAPEMLFQEEYTSGVDIFSLGMVLLEVSLVLYLFVIYFVPSVVVSRDKLKLRSIFIRNYTPPSRAATDAVVATHLV